MYLRDIVLPEFLVLKCKSMDIHALYLLAVGMYLLAIVTMTFLGRDFLRKCDLQVGLRRNVMIYMDVKVPMIPPNYFDDPWHLNEALMLDELFDDFDALATLIEKAKYDYVSADDIVMAQANLDNSQRDQLATMLRNFKTL